MTSRERVLRAINHLQPDRIPVDFGATGQTSLSASVVYRLRKELNLPEKAINITEPFQLLGELDSDLKEFFQSDVIGIDGDCDMFGNPKTNYNQIFTMSDGTPCKIWDSFKFRVQGGECYTFPNGDTSALPCAKVPSDGFFFDGIFRSPPFDEDNLLPLKDFKNAFQVLNQTSARKFEQKANQLYEETDYALIGNLGGAGLGDVALLPGLADSSPMGIRRIEDWLMAHLLFPEYIAEVFNLQTDVMLKNLQIFKQAVGDKIQIVWISGTDFGTQNGGFFSLDVFRKLYKPFYKKINDWVHSNTSWKTFYHTCGSIFHLIPDLIDMGVDVINPVQVSAANMDAQNLKDQFGKKIVFWGGGIDSQKTLPFGTQKEVYNQVKDRLNIFGNGGGYVFSSIHNIVAKTPPKNIIAMLRAVKDFNGSKFH